MYSLMVCDDEQIMIESVRHIVEKELSNIRIIATARSGREAIEKTLTIKPDILLTDIKMPGINGLDAIKEIKKVHSDVKIVLISAYEYFEYAKQAVELGVSEYLIKPVKKESFINTILRITARLDDERRKYRWELAARDRMEKMLSVAEHSFIYSLLFTQIQKNDILEYKKEFFDIQNETGFIFVLMFSKKGEGGSCGAKPEESLENQRICSFFKDNLKRRCKCIVGPVIFDRVVVYAAQSVEDPRQQKVQAIAWIEDTMQLLREKFNIEFKVGIGRIHSDEEIMISYKEALNALNYGGGGRVVHADDIDPNTDKAGFEIATEEHKLITALENGDVHKCLTVLSDIFRKFPDFFDQEDLYYRIIEMMAAARQAAMENGINDITEPGRYIKQILGCQSKERFEQLCTEEIRQIAGAISANKKCNIGEIVKKADKIISERFSQDLALEDISKELYISPQYLSRLYKSEMGENFIERLTSVRIENAKKLLKESKYSVREICFMSGYCDPNYFSKLFKKHEGISPSAYQKQVLKGLLP